MKGFKKKIKKLMTEVTQAIPTMPTPPPSRSKKAAINPRILVLIAIIAVILIGGVLLSPMLKQSSVNITSTPSSGVFTSFSATAMGKVTSISSSQIEIENAGVKKSFKIADNVLITHKSLLDKIADILVSEVEAQAIPPRPSLPSYSIDTQAATGTGTPNIPPAPRKQISQVKVGNYVSLNLTKTREADPWVVTGISVLPN